MGLRDDRKRFSIYIHSEMDIQITKLQEHVSKHTKNHLSRSELFVEAMYYYLDYLGKFAKDDAIVQEILRRRKDHRWKHPHKRYKIDDACSFDKTNKTHSNTQHAEEENRTTEET